MRFTNSFIQEIHYESAQYITIEEVKRVCKAQISDLDKKESPKVSPGAKCFCPSSTGKDKDHLKTLEGLQVELNGITFKDANVTINHPVLTGLIVLAHSKNRSTITSSGGRGTGGRICEGGSKGMQKRQKIL